MPFLSKKDIAELSEKLSQNYEKNLRFGNTPPFPVLDDLYFAEKINNCDLRFSRVYEIDKVLSGGGASGGTVLALKALREKERIERMQTGLRGLPLVVKKVEIMTDKDDENFMDIVIGSRLNLLVAAKIATGFMRTVDWFICHDITEPENTNPMLYIVLERMDQEIIPYLTSQNLIIPELLQSLFAQLLCNLESAQAAVEYVHYDLHTKNVMVIPSRREDLNQAEFWAYERPTGQILYMAREDTNNHEVKMIDFGRNRMNSPLLSNAVAADPKAEFETIYLVGLEQFGIGRQFHRQHDMRRFAMDFIERIMRATIVQTKSGERTDYFLELEKTNKGFYDNFIDVLNAMCGGFYYRSDDSFSSSEKKNLELRLDEYYETEEEKYEALQTFAAFANRGVDYLLVSARKGKFKRFYSLALLYAWTELKFPETPSTILDFPLFDSLRKQPSDGWRVATAMSFKSLLTEKQTGALCSVCAIVPAKTTCLCRQVQYCSENCSKNAYKTHWKYACPVNNAQSTGKETQ